MKILRTGKAKDKTEIAQLMQRVQASAGVSDAVKSIINDVQRDGDAAIIKFTSRFDKVNLKVSALKCSAHEFKQARKIVPKAFLISARRISANVTAYHKRQLPEEWEMNAGNGAILGEIIRPVETVGVYIPGGTAPLVSTLFMTVIPAKIAGVGRIIIATPPNKLGSVNPYILAVADLLGAREVYKIGGAQAIAAMAFGTKTVPKANKVVGPGNIFVAEAKRQLFGLVDIECIAGPSEILVLADKSANAEFVAADILSQAEHGTGEETSLLVTDSESLAVEVVDEIYKQLRSLSRCEMMKKAIEKGTFAIVARNMNEAINISNEFAPEHLEIITRNPKAVLKKIKNAGAVFIGNYSPVPVGDFIAGPSHVLPTNGGAKAFSGLSVADFIKRMGTIEYTRSKLISVKDDLKTIAVVEGLDAHSRTVEIRCRKWRKK
jgi:histidinol dehydrogenase